MSIITTPMFLHTFSPQPHFLNLGPFTIHWYGLLLSIAALSAFFVWRALGQRAGQKISELETLFFWLILSGLIGARLYHVVNEWSYYVANPSEIVKIWNGGLAIHGGLLAGLIVMAVYARRKGISFWRLTDIAVPAVALGQAIGRWGNYFNQELFGQPTNLPWGIPIEPLNRPIEYIGFSHFHPTFLYESIGSLVVFIALLRLFRRMVANGTLERYAGLLTLGYFMAESVIRALTESLRIDRVPEISGVRLPLLVSILLALTAAALLYRRFLRPQPSRT